MGSGGSRAKREAEPLGSPGRERSDRPHTPPVSRVLKHMARLVKVKGKIPEELYWTTYRLLRNQFYASKAWKDLSRKARRIGKKCFFCWGKKKLHAHHVVYLSDEPLRGLDLSNLLVACQDCHMKIHTGLLTVPLDYPRLKNG